MKIFDGSFSFIVLRLSFLKFQKTLAKSKMP
jgi:hypothetical protein